MSLEKLRELPLSREARLALLEDLEASPLPRTPLPQVLGEMAELRLRACEEAYQCQAWSEALEHHDRLLDLVGRLVALAPGQGEVFWGRYGLLLAFFTGAVHGEVTSEVVDVKERAPRADLAWQMAQRLRRAAELPIQPPDWLAVLEEQLVRQGLLLHADLVEQHTAVGGLPFAELHQRALDLSLHLQNLLDPTPEWLEQMLRRLIERQVNAVLAVDPPEPEQLAKLLANLERLPVDKDRSEAFAVALTRTRLSLDLLAPELGLSADPAGSGPVAERASAPVDAAEDAPTLEIPAIAEEPRVAEDAPTLELPAIPEEPWEVKDSPILKIPAIPEEPGVAELVWLEDGVEAASLVQLNLRPLLEAPFEQIDEALDEFCCHLPKGSRALQAAPALTRSLEPRWRTGQRLEAPAFERLAYLAGSWQRRLAERLEPLPQHDWRYGLLVELATGELDVLLPLLAAPQELEPLMAQLRREHHQGALWQQRQEVPWMQCPSPLEALRRLHVEEGFYARSHPPMESLRSWGREVVLALSEAELWTDDAGCLGRWLAVVQELVLSQQGPVPELGRPPQPEQLLIDLGGLELVYVGDGAAAVQEAHRAGHCFRGQPFGLRVMEGPESRWPARPSGGFEQSLAVLLESVDALYRQRPFDVLLADCGAYRLPLLRAVQQRYGVAAMSSGRPMAKWLVGS
jgi:hypothetical protein